jgi:hypothetical protein
LAEIVDAYAVALGEGSIKRLQRRTLVSSLKCIPVGRDERGLQLSVQAPTSAEVEVLQSQPRKGYPRRLRTDEPPSSGFNGSRDFAFHPV